MKTIYNTKNSFLDEIQNIPNLEIIMNRLQRQRHNIVLTGSNANPLGRELRSLIEANKELNCKELIVITKNTEKEIEYTWYNTKRKIKIIPCYKYLLQN